MTQASIETIQVSLHASGKEMEEIKVANSLEVQEEGGESPSLEFVKKGVYIGAEGRRNSK